MIADLFAVVASAAVVPDEALDPATAAPDGLEKVNSLDDEFLALIYSDEELLRDEFDALLAAAWASPPPADARDRGSAHPPENLRSDLPAIGRLLLAVDAGPRTATARTRAPPDTTDGSPSP